MKILFPPERTLACCLKIFPALSIRFQGYSLAVLAWLLFCYFHCGDSGFGCWTGPHGALPWQQYFAVCIFSSPKQCLRFVALYHAWELFKRWKRCFVMWSIPGGRWVGAFPLTSVDPRVHQGSR